MDTAIRSGVAADRGGAAAVGAMAFCAGLLVASEFIPVSFLPQMAADLGLNPGQAGQAVSISGLFAVATSLLAPRITRDLDRRTALAGFAALMVISAVIVSSAPDYITLMVGRALLGAAVGGFWSMTTAVVLRLMPRDMVPRGIALLNMGVAFSGVVAAPLGSALSGMIGWRATVLAIAPLAVIAAGLMWRAMPTLPPRELPRSNPLALLTEAVARRGMTAVFLIFAGYFALYTYLRPWMEGAGGLGTALIPAAFLALGLAGLLGSWTMGRAVPRSPWGTAIGLPLVMAAIAILMILLAGQPLAAFALVAAWGLAATGAPVVWGSWLARSFAGRAEVAGGLHVATIQLAIMSGSAAGGIILDHAGWAASFAFAALLLTGASLAAVATRRRQRREA